MLKSEDGDFSVSFVVFTFLWEMEVEMSIRRLEIRLRRLVWVSWQGCMWTWAACMYRTWESVGVKETIQEAC